MKQKQYDYWVQREDGTKFKIRDSPEGMRAWANSFKGKYRPRIQAVGAPVALVQGRNIRKKPVARRRSMGFVPFSGGWR